MSCVQAPHPHTPIIAAHHQIGGHVAVTRDQAADVRRARVSVSPRHVARLPRIITMVINEELQFLSLLFFSPVAVEGVLGGGVEARGEGLPGEDARLARAHPMQLVALVQPPRPRLQAASLSGGPSSSHIVPGIIV